MQCAMLLSSFPLLSGGFLQWGAGEDSLKLNAHFPFLAWCECCLSHSPAYPLPSPIEFACPRERAIWIVMLQYRLFQGTSFWQFSLVHSVLLVSLCVRKSADSSKWVLCSNNIIPIFPFLSNQGYFFSPSRTSLAFP